MNKRMYLMALFVQLSSGAAIAWDWLFCPWWLALPLTAIVVAGGAAYLYAYTALTYIRGASDEQDALTRDVRKMLAQHVVNEVISKAPYN